MAMGKREGQEQQSFWSATADLPRAAGHPYDERLNRLLDDAGFDAFVEAACCGF